MKKHNTFKVVLITILVLMLLSWILPAAYFQNSYVEQGRVQMGLFDLFNYPITAISYFSYIAIYFLVVGGLYGVLSKIPAYRIILDKLVSTFKGKEKIVLSVVMVLLAILTSVCGLQLGIIVLFPMIVSIVLLMGYDKITAALVTVGSTMIGVAGTTFGFSNTNMIVSVLSIKLTSEMISKILILVVGLALLIFNTLVYIKKIDKKDTKKATKKTTKSAAKSSKVLVDKNDIELYVPEKVSTRKKVTVWPIVTFMCLLLVILVLSFISWSNAFSIKAFESATKSVTEFKIFGFEIFGKLLGSVNAFGTWSLSDMSVVIIVSILLLSVIYKMSFDEVIEGFVSGAKRALAPAVVTILIYTCLVITTYHPFQLVVYKALFGLTKEFSVLIGTVVAILASILNVDPSYAFQSVLPYLTTVFTDKSSYSLIGVVFQSVYGITMLVAPTSVVLMSVLSYLDISYSKWFKTIWKLLLELLGVLLIVFLIIALV